MQSQTWLYAAAGYNMALALFHLAFWRIFRWGEELPKLHAVNRGVMQVMNIMLILVLLFFAALQLLLAGEVSGTALGRMVQAGLVFFWIARAILQPIFWKGVPQATNVAFVLLFLVGAGVHAFAFKP